ncbi:MAG: DUF433 domain-containing protein [Nitrococcus sp.]|nr:DUF433 domain-containing protein [Nitrococcus sp.]
MTVDEILADYQGLEREDIFAALAPYGMLRPRLVVVIAGRVARPLLDSYPGAVIRIYS